MTDENESLVRHSRDRLFVKLGFIDTKTGDEYEKECRSKRITPRLLKKTAAILATIDMTETAQKGAIAQKTVDIIKLNKELAGRKDVKLSEIKIPQTIKDLKLKPDATKKIKSAIMLMLKQNITTEADIFNFGNRVEYQARVNAAANLFLSTIDISELEPHEIEFVDSGKIKVGDETITFNEIQGVSTISEYVRFFRRISQNATE